MDISELFGFLKKSAINFSLPIKGMASGNWCSKKLMRSLGVFSDDIIDSGMKSVQVKDLSYNQLGTV